MPGRKGRSKPWKEVTQNLPKIPSMSNVSRITLPNGRVVDWQRIRRDYNEQIEGQKYARSRIAADLEKKRAAFEEVATAAWLIKQGFAPHITGRILGELPSSGEHPRARNGITIKTWMWGGRLPPAISLKRHEYHQGSRAPVKLRASGKYELGYIAGLSSSGGITLNMNPQTGKSRIGVFSPSPGIVNEFSRAVNGAFGLKAWTTKPPKNKPTHRQRMRASVESTNLLRVMSPLFRDRASAVTYLPDHPRARLGFTRAVLDKGNARIDLWKNSKRVLVTHEDPRVMGVVSQTLTEKGIPHERRIYRGKESIHVPGEGIPAFKRKIGFRDEERQKKL